MSKKTFLTQIIVTYCLGLFFVVIAYSLVLTDGWDLFSILSIFLATSNIVRATKMTQFYMKANSNNKNNPQK